jgi:hypothetical protein
MIAHKEIIIILSKMLIARCEDTLYIDVEIKIEVGRKPVPSQKPNVSSKKPKDNEDPLRRLGTDSYWKWAHNYLKQQKYSLHQRQDDFYELVKEFRRIQNFYLELSNLPSRSNNSLPNYIYSGWYKAALKDQIENIPEFLADDSEENGIKNYQLFINTLPKLKNESYKISAEQLNQYLKEIEQLKRVVNKEPAFIENLATPIPQYYICSLDLMSGIVSMKVERQGRDGLELKGTFTEKRNDSSSKIIYIDVEDDGSSPLMRTLKDNPRKTHIVLLADSRDARSFVIGTYTSVHRRDGYPFSGLILLEKQENLASQKACLDEVKVDKNKISSLYWHLLQGQILKYPNTSNGEDKHKNREFRIDKVDKLPNYEVHNILKEYAGSYKTYIFDSDRQQIKIVYIHITSAGMCLQLGNSNSKHYGSFKVTAAGPLVGTIHYKDKLGEDRHDTQVILQRQETNRNNLVGIFSAISKTNQPLAGRIALVRESNMDKLDIWADDYTKILIRAKTEPLKFDQITYNPKFETNDDLITFFGKDNKNVYIYLIGDSNLFSNNNQTLPSAEEAKIDVDLIGIYHIYCLSSTPEQINKMPIQVLADGTITVKVKNKENKKFICTGIIEEDLPSLIARTISPYREGGVPINPNKYTQQFVFYHGAPAQMALNEPPKLLWGTFSFRHHEGFAVAGKCLLMRDNGNKKFADMAQEYIAVTHESVQSNLELKKLLSDKLIKVSQNG